MVQTNVTVASNVGVQPSNSGTVGSLCFNESYAPDFEKLTDLVLMSNAFPGRPSRESVQGLAKTCWEMCGVDLTEVHSPSLFNQRLTQLDLEIDVTNAAASCELQDRKS